MTRLPPALRPLWPLGKRVYTAGTLAASFVTPRLAARRDGWLPTRTADLVDEPLEPGVTVHAARPAQRIRRRPPAGIDARNPTFEAECEIPRRIVAEMAGGRVLGPQRAVITGEGTLVHELSQYFGTSRAREHPIFLTPHPAAPLEVDGRLGVLASRADGNYYHFLIDVLPRLGLLEQAGVEPPARWYLPLHTRFQRELADTLGLTADVVDADAHPHVRATTLVVPSLPDLHLRTPGWVVEFLRARLLPPGSALEPGRRIYVTRGDRPHTRIVRNEAAVLGALRDFGFERVDPGALSVAEQIRTFARAEVIVAPHGAALANLAFAAPGASVLELFPPDYVQGCYWKLADGVPGLRYRHLVGLGRSGRPDRPFGVASDITVDLRALVAAVQALLVPAPR